MSRIAIVGNGPLTRGLAPYGDWECWGIAERAAQFEQEQGRPRGFNKIFELHDEPSHYVINQQIIFKEDLPLDKLRELTEPEGFKSSLAWMIAYAILQEPEEIGLWGFDCALIQKTEYEDQIPNIKYMLGLARGKGIKLTAPWQSYLFGQDNYGERIARTG